MGGCVSCCVLSLKLVEGEMCCGDAVGRGGYIGVVAANGLEMSVRVTGNLL